MVVKDQGLSRRALLLGKHESSVLYSTNEEENIRSKPVKSKETIVIVVFIVVIAVDLVGLSVEIFVIFVILIFVILIIIITIMAFKDIGRSAATGNSSLCGHL